MFSQKIRSATALITSVVFLAACGAQNARNAERGGVFGGGGITKSDVGTVIGAAGGAALGSRIGGGSGRVAAIAVGTLIGAGLGREVGASLDRADMSYYQRTQQTALETANSGETLPWRNPQSGNQGSFTPSNYYTNDSGQYCREFTQEIQVGGKIEEGYGRACRQEDGSWRIVNSEF